MMLVQRLAISMSVTINTHSPASARFRNNSPFNTWKHNICIYFTFIPNTIVIKTNQTKQILENIANILNDVMLCINKPLTHNS